MELSYVLPRIIFETVVGSRAYGTNHADSDYDKSGVMIPGKEYFYSWREFEEFGGFPEKDRKVYNIKKALSLIKDNNPNMMDLLWVPERCIVTQSKYWENIMTQRSLFVCKRVRYTFSGYAIAQLNRIKVHRKFLLNPPLVAPTRAEYGLPADSMFPTSQLKAVVYAALEFIADEEKSNFFNELDGIYGDYVIPLLARFLKEEERSTAMEWLQLGIKSQSKAFLSLGTKYLKDEYVDIAHKEVLFYDASKEWAQYQNWKKNRNKARAVLEEKYGFDCKHAMHLVRLLRTGKEVLETGEVHVDRTDIDAKELIEIRNGSWSYDQIEDYTKKMDADLGALYETSTLQKHPDDKKIEELCINTIDQYLSEEK